MIARNLTVAIGLVFGLSACNVEGALNEIEKDLVDSAFESIKEAAEEKGGTAVMVHAGHEATMEVTDESSDLFGAKVVIPADVLPEGTKYAAATIQGGAKPDTPEPDHVKTVGPFAGVALLGLPSGLPIKPEAAVSITLPYAEDVSYPTEEFGLAHFGKGVSVASDSAVDVRALTVTGSAKNLKGFFAPVWEVDYDGSSVDEGVFAYKVENGDKTVCVGLQEDVIVGDSSVDVSATSSDITFFLAAGTTNNITFESGVFDLDPAGIASFPKALPSGSLSLGCNGSTFSGTAVSGFSVVSWTETGGGSNTADCAGGSNNCNVRTGTVEIAGTVSYTADSGESVKAGINVTLENFSWYYY